MQYNKGEWSELYAFLTILYQREVPAADKLLNPTDESYHFLEIIREDEPGKIRLYNLEKDNYVVILNDQHEEIKEIEAGELPPKTRKILSEIQSHDKGTFAIPEANEAMNMLDLQKVKANSSEKSDIDAIVRDKIATRQRLGFSIKSRLGGASTLLNASSHTEFQYKVCGINNSLLIDKRFESIKELIEYIYENGGYLEYQRVTSPIFSSNLRMIDTVLPNILASMLLIYYSGQARTIPEICSRVAENNEYYLSEKDIDFKVKNLLRSIALGMMPGKPWNARLSTYGGYIVVKENGDLVCYHLYNDDDFKDYLYENTKFDTPSTSRHDFGYLYDQDSELYLKLNFQIRFKK